MKPRIEYWDTHAIRFVERSLGDWWAVARDVAAALGRRDAHSPVRMVPDEDRDTHPVPTAGGVQDMIILSEFGIYDAVFGSRKPEARAFKRWAFDTLRALRQASGLEGYEVFRMLDKEHQRAAMDRLKRGTKNPDTTTYIKANTIANKAVSNAYGQPKMLRKRQMTPDMLARRQPILDDTVNLMQVKDSFDIELSVSGMIYRKYNGDSPAAAREF